MCTPYFYYHFMKNFVRQYKYSLLCFIVIFILMAIPGTMIPPIPNFRDWLQWDKISHLLFFGGLSYVMLRDRYQSPSVNNKFFTYGFIFFIGVSYGAFTEWFQHLPFVKRDGNYFDWCADIIGVALGMLLFSLLLKKKNN